ncbi:MAG: hypothetical protein SCALA702_33220 [Melioribacteraceae bacterium]|nr:MAG: hypothetical protein SCALA702_33220 [Melioribacteraceae bacterium]
MRTFLLFLVVFSSCIAQEYYNWAERAYPEKIYSITSLSLDSLMIYTRDYQIYRTFDGGINWENITNPDLINNTRLSCVDGRVFLSKLVAWDTTLIYYSDDFGDTFHPVDFNYNIRSVKFMDTPEGLLHANGSQGKFFRSTDLGETWEYYCDLPPGANNIQITSEGIIYCRSSEKILELNYFSLQWKELTSPFSIENITVNSEVFVTTANGHLYYSSDMTESWVSCDTSGGNLHVMHGENDKLYLMVYHNFDNSEMTYGLFKLEFSPFREIQIGSFTVRRFVEIFFYNDGIIYPTEDKIYVKKEEYFPEFKNTYYPLALGNEYFLGEVTINESIQDTTFNLRKFVIDNKVNLYGKDYYNSWIGADTLFEHFDESENRIYTYTQLAGIDENVSFNYIDNYLQPVTDRYVPRYYYQALYDSTFTYSGFELSIKEYRQATMQNSLRRRNVYLENYGLLETEYSRYFMKTEKKSLLQSRILTPENDTLIYDTIDDPVILFSIPEIVYTTDVDFSVEVQHDLIRYGYEYQYFIKDFYLEYYYDKNGVTTNVERIYFDVDSIGTTSAFYNGTIELHFLHIGGPDKLFKYRFHAVTNGIIPHATVSPAEGWNQIEYSSTTAVEDITELTCGLSPNYPNPFNPSTKMEFTLPKESEVEMAVFNVTGERLFTIIKKIFKPGRHSITINMADYSTGVYFVSLITETQRITRKITLIK